MKVQAIVTAVQEVSNDTDGITYTNAQIYGWIDDALRALLAKRPDALVELRTVKLVAGTKQTLPTDAHKLTGVNRNMGVSGVVSGKAIRGPVAQEELDAFDPDWHNAEAKDVVEEYVYNLADPLEFYVIPPMKSEVLAAAVTTALVTAGYPASISTTTNHNLVTGGYVYISDHTSETDGYHAVTVTSPATFTINVTGVLSSDAGSVQAVTSSPAQVEARICVSAQVITDVADDVPVSDIYSPALIDWCLYRMFARDSEKTPNFVRAKEHYRSFHNIIDGKSSMDVSTEPKVVENV